MLFRPRWLVFLPLAALVACGGSTSPPVGTSFTPVAGDYVITVAPGTASAGFFTGNLAVSGSSVSGVFRYSNPGTVCVSGTQDIPFTGAFSNSVLTLTSTAFSNSVATLTVHLPLSTNNIGADLAGGTALITGGTCALASSTLQAQLIPTYTGPWTVTITTPASETLPLSLSESTTADGDGQFTVSGTTGCGGTTINLTGLVSGPTLQLTNAPLSTQPAIVVTANNSAEPVTVNVSGACAGIGTMTQ
jgi:hypothetical protein